MTTISDATLTKIENDTAWARMRRTHDSPSLSRFRYDHGNLLYVDSSGRTDILFLSDGDNMKWCAARHLHNLAPPVVQELIRGYRAAKKAGLIE